MFGHLILGSGGKKTFKRYLTSEHADRQTDRQTDTQADTNMDKATYRKHRPRGLMHWKSAEEDKKKSTGKLASLIKSQT